MNRRHFFRGLLGLPLIGLVPASHAATAPSAAIPVAVPIVPVRIQQSPVAGFQYHQGQKVWQRLRIGHRLRLEREPRNPHDANAIVVYWNDIKIGYIPRRENKTLAGMLDAELPLVASIGTLHESRDPWQRVGVEVALYREGAV